MKVDNTEVHLELKWKPDKKLPLEFASTSSTSLREFAETSVPGIQSLASLIKGTLETSLPGNADASCFS